MEFASKLAPTGAPLQQNPDNTVRLSRTATGNALRAQYILFDAKADTSLHSG